MDSLATGMIVFMACLLLAVVVETIYFMMRCDAAEPPRHSRGPAYRGSLRQKLPPLFQNLWGAWKKRKAKARRGDEGESSQIPMASSSSQAVLTISPYCVEAPSCGDIWQIEGLVGPPRFLFTINEEEAEEDLECEEGRSKNGRSCRTSRTTLSDFFSAMPSQSLEVITPAMTEHVFPPTKSVASFPANVPPASPKLESLSPRQKQPSFNIQEPPSPPANPLSFHMDKTTSPRYNQEATSPLSKPLSFYIQQDPASPQNPATRTLASCFQQVPPCTSPGRVSHLNRIHPVGWRGPDCSSPVSRDQISMQKQIEGIPILGGGRKLQSDMFPRELWSPSPPPSSSPFQPASSHHSSIAGEEEMGMPFVDHRRSTSS